MRRPAIIVRGVAAIGTALLFCGDFVGRASTAEQLYRQVYVGEIIQGYVPNGERVETSGYFWISQQANEEGAFLNVALPSQQVPLIVDLSRLPADKRENARLRCTANSLGHVGGCEVTVRGETGMVGKRRAIFADDLMLNP